MSDLNVKANEAFLCQLKQSAWKTQLAGLDSSTVLSCDLLAVHPIFRISMKIIFNSFAGQTAEKIVDLKDSTYFLVIKFCLLSRELKSYSG